MAFDRSTATAPDHQATQRDNRWKLSDIAAVLNDVGFVCCCASQHILLFELFDQTRVFLFDVRHSRASHDFDRHQLTANMPRRGRGSNLSMR
jgi:hypothetical protein